MICVVCADLGCEHCPAVDVETYDRVLRRARVKLTMSGGRLDLLSDVELAAIALELCARLEGETRGAAA